MLSQIAGVVLSLSTPAGLFQNSFGWSGDAIGPAGIQAGEGQYADGLSDWDRPGLAAYPNCHAQASAMPDPTAAGQAETIAQSPPLPAVSGQYQLDGGFYVRESGPLPTHRIGLDLMPAGSDRSDRPDRS